MRKIVLGMNTKAGRSTISTMMLAAAFAFGDTAALGDTADGQFAIEGAGIATCTAFKEAQEANSDAYSRMIGWVEGYLTASNRHMPDTYDLSPWQVAQLYGVIIGGHCETNPEERLVSVVQKMVVGLTADRLTTRSETVSLSSRKPGTSAQILYVEVIRRVQEALITQGLYHGEANGQFDGDTQKSVEFYQAAVGIDVTGLPDPLTLWLLFSATAAPGGP